MKISIITVSHNSVATIEDTIKSVINQNYPDWEYVIIDGGSTDGTLEIIKKYQDKITKIISEPDQGIYDAMNKGIKLATGDIVGIINSDDFYINENVLSKVVFEFSYDDIGAVYGDIVLVDNIKTDKIVRFWKAGDYNSNKLSSGWIPPHPAFFVRKSVYDRLGMFNLKFRIAADYELMLRFLKNGVRIKYLPETLVKMRVGGESGRSFKQRRRGWRELKDAWAVNGWNAPKFFIIRRVLSKITQFLFKPKI